MEKQTAAWQPTQAEVDEKPWKYTGYQSFAAFVASDNDFFILRRFGALSARVLLGLQDQLSCLEEDLNELEKRTRINGAPDVHNGSFRQDTQEERQVLVSQAQRLLRDYSQSCLFFYVLSKLIPTKPESQRLIDVETHIGATDTSLIFFPISTSGY